MLAAAKGFEVFLSQHTEFDSEALFHSWILCELREEVEEEMNKRWLVS